MYDNTQNSTNETICAYRTEISSLNWESRRFRLIFSWRWLQLETRRFEDMHGMGPWITIALLTCLSIVASIVTAAFVAGGHLALLFFSAFFAAVFGAGFCVCLGSFFIATDVAEQAYALQLKRITDLHHRRTLILGKMSRLIEIERARMERERAQRFAEEKAEQSRVWDCLSRDRCPECNVKYAYYHSRVDGGPDRRYNVNPLVCAKCDQYRSRRWDEFERDERRILQNYRGPARKQWLVMWGTLLIVGIIVTIPAVVIMSIYNKTSSSNNSSSTDAANSQLVTKTNEPLEKQGGAIKHPDKSLDPKQIPAQGSITDPTPSSKIPITPVKPQLEPIKPADPTLTEPVKPKSKWIANATVTGSKTKPIAMGKLAAMLEDYRDALAFNTPKAKKMISDGDIVIVTNMLPVCVESRARGFAYLRPTEGDSEGKLYVVKDLDAVPDKK